MGQEARKKRRNVSALSAKPGSRSKGLDESLVQAAAAGAEVQILLEFEKYLQKREAMRRLSGRGRRARFRSLS